MAFRLDAWLEETFESQLLLSNHWLQERHARKKSGVKVERDRDWEGLYHENGSCLDITNSIHPDRNSALQVLQTEPFTLTDGQSHIVAHVAPDCARDFTTRYPAFSYLSPGSLIAVRKYTIRYTPYGPPRARVRFVLHQIDWLCADCPKRPGVNSPSLVAVHQGHQVAVLLQQLFEARAREDSRCLALGGETEIEDTMGGAPDESQPQDGDTSTHSQMPPTQVAFGTQVQHPIRMRPDTEEPQTIGVNRLEPVLAGKTQRADIQPRATNISHERLVSLLGNLQNASTVKPSAKFSLGFIQGAFAKQSSVDNTAAAADQPPQPSPTSPSQQLRTEPRTPRATVPSPSPEKRRSKDVSSPAPPSEKATKRVQTKDVDVEREIPEQAATSALECSWMKGFIFNSQSLKVPALQRECLSKETSWLKPQTRVPFQNGNMPQTILQNFHRIADEQAALREEGDSDDESDIDPSPDSLPANINLSAESVPQTTQDDDPSSSDALTWEATPEPPPLPVNVHEELPPDSSLEEHTSSAEQHPKTHSASPTNQSQQSDVIEILDNDSEPESSPPAIQAPADSDDEMEMDESVPQALGEDLTEKQSPYAKNQSAPSPKSCKVQSIVQVRETPYGKGKMADHMASTAPDGSNLKHGCDSSAESTHPSSNSIVHSTYDMPAASKPAEVEQCHTEESDVVLEEKTSNIEEKVETHNAPTESRLAHNSEDVQMIDLPLNTEESVKATVVESGPQAPTIITDKKAPSVTAKTTPKPTKSLPTKTRSETSPAMPHVASSSTKRKLDDSPVKGNRRHSKRREIKIVGFGDTTPVPTDPRAKLREDREASLRRFREEQNSSTSFESRAESTSKLTEMASTEALELESVEVPNGKVAPVNRSTRHQSLHEEPIPRPTVVSRSQLPPDDVSSRKQPQLSQIQDPSPQNAQTPDTPVISTPNTPTTIFQTFKATYPEYKGDTKHFLNQCKQMQALDLQDKMVPKWQWDDFIIRNRTDYRDYAMACLDQGETAEPYYRFYKDNIRDTLYRRGVIESRRTLQQALEELGVVDATASISSLSNNAPVRKSLPGSFHQPRRPAQDHIVASSSARPRHSLPTSSHSRHHKEKHAMTRTSRPSNRPNNSSTDQQAQQSTGDPFRDYFFAIQRSTSWTGDDKIDTTKPWPANLAIRRSVQDAPRGKVDVLRWGDVLGGGREFR